MMLDELPEPLKAEYGVGGGIPESVDSGQVEARRVLKNATRWRCGCSLFGVTVVTFGGPGLFFLVACNAIDVELVLLQAGLPAAGGGGFFRCIVALAAGLGLVGGFLAQSLLGVVAA